MNKLYLMSCMALVLLCVGCGSSNGGSGTGFGGGGTTGSFSNSNLKGNYAYQITGYDLTTGSAVPFREAGAFLADGNGNVTGGEDDFAEGTTVLGNVMAASTYSISSDGTGVATLNFTNGGGVQVALAVESAPTVYLAVNAAAQGGANLIVNGTGVATAQTTSAFAAAPSGTFVFRTHNLSAVQGSSASVGAITITGGVPSGSEDELKGGVETQLTVAGGLFTPPDSFGRNTATLTDNLGVTSPFSYYVIDSGHFYLFSTALTGSIGVGQAEAQSGTFSASSLSGSYVFGSRGDDSSFLGGVNTVGQFSASNGAITGGQFDSVQDGNPTTPGTFSSSTYTIASNGRAVVNLSPSTGIPAVEILWLVSPSRAFLLTNDTTKVEDGTVDLQQSSSFSNSSLNGMFGFANDGFLNSTAGLSFYDRAGYLHWDGAGNLGVKEFLNVSGSAETPGILNGSYTVASNGRAVGNVGTLSSNLIFYLISGNQAYMLQGDTGVEINGTMGTIP
jgi:hypothetical protein